MSDPQWRARAACLNAGESFERALGVRQMRALIRNYCAVCPVIGACLSFTLAAEGNAGAQSRHFVAGGMTPSQRAKHARALRKEMQ